MKILSLLLLLVACSYHAPPTRSEYRLLNEDGFLISNIYVHPTQIYHDKDKIKFDYNLVVKNIKDTERVISLNGAFIMIGLRTVPIACTSKIGQQTFVIKSQETLGINCKVRLSKQEGVFQVSDYRSMIEIPLDTTKARFAYLLRAEDFK